MVSDRQLTLEEIYSSHRQKIVRYLSRLVGEHEAEDLAQEVFLKVGRALGNFRGDAQLSSWIYRIATNTAMDRLRAGHEQGMSEEKLSIDVIKDSEDKNVWTDEKAPSVEQQLILLEMHHCIHTYVGKLPENYRIVLVLSDLEGFKNQEIAKILGLSLSAVKTRLHRARARLKSELEASCRFYYDERNQLACVPKDALPATR